MKRRTIDASKLRRPVKRSRITDSVYSSWLLYLRSFIIWLIVITMDFTLEFRFEFLWPFWLLIKSSFDSFKYQGLGLTILFISITLFSDIICFLLLPTHWLFFVASTYVWVQFVCSTDRGPCITTVCLWLLFVYVEASVRLQELKSVPFNLDLCRPFAAHCIGYPVVSLGYGFKSYIGYRIKHYQQCEVAKQNKFYHQLVSDALPAEVNDENLQVKKPMILANSNLNKLDVDTVLNSETKKRSIKQTIFDERQNNSSLSLNDLEVIPCIQVKDFNKKNEADNFRPSVKTVNKTCNGEIKRFKFKKTESDNDAECSDSEQSSISGDVNQDNSPKTVKPSKSDALHVKLFKDEQTLRRKAEAQVLQLECELKKLRNEMQSARQLDVQSRTQIKEGLSTERYLTSELDQLNSDNGILQQKIISLNNMKSQEKVLITSLEKKLKFEKESRINAENQLLELKKKKNEAINKIENHDSCLSKRQELENEISKLQAKLNEATNSISDLKKESLILKQKNPDADWDKMKKDLEFLNGALNIMKGKNIHLENSLSSETRLKLDLFSALGDTRRQLEVVHSQLNIKSAEVEALKGKIAEVMAVMPSQYHSLLNGFVSTNSFISQTNAETVVSSASYDSTKQKWLNMNGTSKVAH
ncbi:macoilin-1 isoform X2 [Hydra vulgaris]|uniref:Macoilin n=1 Tax=Hydra vulgaris TaxID=6087 RepID=A0ABM4BIZ3_HYDVU